jgi:hypothetical protein
MLNERLSEPVLHGAIHFFGDGDPTRNLINGDMVSSKSL